MRPGPRRLGPPDQRGRGRGRLKLATTTPDSVSSEKFASGDDYRVLVVDGRVVSAARRVPAHVVGDGQRSVAALTSG